VVGALGLLQIVLVACLAFDGCAGEVADLGAGMAPKAGDGGVDTGERETGSIVLGDLAFGDPVSFGVARGAVLSELATMHILVATGTATLRKGPGGAAVVVTAQALGFGVGAVQCDARFFRVVVNKVGANLVPASLLMA
jgi:hypothetical protein